MFTLSNAKIQKKKCHRYKIKVEVTNQNVIATTLTWKLQIKIPQPQNYHGRYFTKYISHEVTRLQNIKKHCGK